MVGVSVQRLKSTQTKWPIYASLVLTGFLVGGGMAMGIYEYVYGSTIGSSSLAPEASVLSLPAPSTGPIPKIVRISQDPIVAAKSLKPLVDIQKEDRVIYHGVTCKWIEWNGNINTSVIKCPGRSLLHTDTVQLTPVEGRGVH
jgi:hypothetical protein